MASLAKALNDYVGNLRAIQLVAQQIAQLPITFYDGRPELSVALSSVRVQRDAILLGLSTAITFTDREKENLSALINAAYDSTEAVLDNPRGSSELGKQLGQFWAEIRPFVKHVTTVLIGLAGVAAGTYIGNKYILPQILDPTGVKAREESYFAGRNSCRKALAECETAEDRPSCMRSARRYCKEMEEITSGDSDSCGLLQTPYGTLIGGLLGVGLGWAGMRRIMGW